MVAQCCYHGQSPPITTNHPPITSEIHDQSPSNHLKTTSTGTTYHRPVTSTEHETFSLSPSLFLSRTLVQSRLFFPSLAFLNQRRAGTATKKGRNRDGRQRDARGTLRWQEQRRSTERCLRHTYTAGLILNRSLETTFSFSCVFSAVFPKDY